MSSIVIVLYIIIGGICITETADDDFSIVVAVVDGFHGNLGCFGFRIPIDSCAYAGEGNALYASFLGYLQSSLIAGGEHPWLIASTIINGANRVNDIFAGQIICARYLTQSSFTASQGLALLQEPGAGSPMDGSIHATTTKQ